MGRSAGVTDEELEALRRPAPVSLFHAREQAALDYAEAITLSNEVDAGLFEKLRRHFSEEAIIELTATITWEICAAKFNRALEIEGHEPEVCPLPAGRPTSSPQALEPDFRT